MRHFNKMQSFSMLLLTSILAACGTQVEVETREEDSAGALQGKNNVATTGCVTADLQRATCVDPSEFKQEAYEVCLQSNTVLTDLKFPSFCADGLADSAQYTCCAAPPPSPPPAPPTEPNPGCVFEYIGDGQTCQDSSAIKLLGYDACLETGGNLTNLWVQDPGSCNEGEGVSLGYECCPAPPPPPPPVVCLSGTIGDGQTCMDLGNIKTTAHEACQQAGVVLFDLQITDVGSCAPNEGLVVTYQCTTYDANGCP